MNRTEEEENSKYLSYLALKREAVRELEENSVARMESEVEYVKEENRYMALKLESLAKKVNLLGQRGK